MANNTNLPPRVQQIIIDNETGSYPTTSRVGDIRSGRYQSVFDDRKTIAFSAGVTVSYPTTLKAGSTYIANASSSLTASGNVVKGVADDGIVRDLHGQDLTPFNESYLFEQSKFDDFHTTGSDISDVGFGFTGPLRSKTVIDIDLTPISSMSLQYKTKWTTLAGSTGSYPMYTMGYYNFSNKVWDPIGTGEALDFTETGALVDIGPPRLHDVDEAVAATQARYNLDRAMIGFSPVETSIDFSVDDEKEFAYPIDTFLFPFDARYHATSSQLFHLSGVLDTPFLLEKLEYEFSASLDTSDWSASPSMMTFFVLNQRSPAAFYIERNIIPVASYNGRTDVTTKITSSVPETRRLTTSSWGTSDAPLVYVDTTRDLVTYARVMSSDTAGFSSVYARELNLVPGGGSQNFSGTLVMSATAQVASQNTYRGAQELCDHPVPNTDADLSYYYVGSQGSGRVQSDQPTGRDLVTSLYKSTPVPIVESSGFYSTTSLITVPHVQQRNNPYVLLPTDKLVFGWQAPIPSLYTTYGPIFKMLPGPSKLRLYGSLIREHKEAHDTLNPPLTTPSLHEDVHASMVLDQFDTEPRMFFEGSYLGEYLTGSVSATSALSRKVIASTVSSSMLPQIPASTTLFITADITDLELRKLTIGGFSRNIRLSTSNERMYDTILPNMGEITVLNGAEVIAISTNEAIFIVGNKNSVLSAYSIDETWGRAFPFEPKYSTVSRNLSSVMKYHVGNRDLLLLPARTIVPQGAVGYRWLTTPEHANKDMFGIGSALSGSAAPAYQYTLTVGPDPISVGYYYPKPRGFKYGVLNSEPQFSSAVFRRSSYGQFRDMLEQRLDTKFFDVLGLNSDGTYSGHAGVLSSPVTVKFVEPNSAKITSPYRTFSSNMSPEATSSLPYFDDIVRNREDPLDTTELNSFTLSI